MAIEGDILLAIFCVGICLVTLGRPLTPEAPLKKKIKGPIVRHNDLLCFAEIFVLGHDILV